LIGGSYPLDDLSDTVLFGVRRRFTAAASAFAAVSPLLLSARDAAADTSLPGQRFAAPAANKRDVCRVRARGVSRSQVLRPPARPRTVHTAPRHFLPLIWHEQHPVPGHWPLQQRARIPSTPARREPRVLSATGRRCPARSPACSARQAAAAAAHAAQAATAGAARGCDRVGARVRPQRGHNPRWRGPRAVRVALTTRAAVLRCTGRSTAAKMALADVGLVGLAVMGQVRLDRELGAVGVQSGSRWQRLVSCLSPARRLRAEPGPQHRRKGLPHLRVQPLVREDGGSGGQGRQGG
jgi:hypothetical protein